MGMAGRRTTHVRDRGKDCTGLARPWSPPHRGLRINHFRSCVSGPCMNSTCEHNDSNTLRVSTSLCTPPPEEYPSRFIPAWRHNGPVYSLGFIYAEPPADCSSGDSRRPKQVEFTCSIDNAPDIPLEPESER